MLLYLLAVVLLIVILFIIRILSYWKILGVPGPLPYPIVGNIGANLIGRKNVAEIYMDIYREFNEYPFVGIFRGGTPCILIRDPELIRSITIKDFKHFSNNEIYMDKEVDPLLARNLFVLKDQEWKNERERFTTGFSSARIKSVFPIMEGVSEKMLDYVENEVRISGNFLNVKEICSRFTCDNVAVCVFGLEGKSFEESNFEFRELGQFLAPESVQSIKFALTMIVPNLTNLFSVKVIPKEVDDRLIQIVSQTIEYRKSNKIVRNDFMDLVSQLEYSDTQNSLVEIAAHLTAFFIEGFETSSVVMSYALYELARNEDSQEKLRNEIQDVLEKHNGIFSYDALQEMTFLDACLYETLRLHPTSGFQPKTCTERHELESTNPEYAPLSVTIEPGTPIILPVLALHMDPKHYPDPEKFIPERFSKDNNYNYVFLAFGIGPRSCVGQRFGQLQIKIGLAQLIRYFKISVNEKTPSSVDYLPFYFLLFPKGGIWLDFQKI